MESNSSKGYILNVMLMALILLVSKSVHSVEKVTYYHNDHLGSPVAATDGGGNVVWRESYQPFGTREQHQGDAKNTLWFTGKQEENKWGQMLTDPHKIRPPEQSHSDPLLAPV